MRRIAMLVVVTAALFAAVNSAPAAPSVADGGCWVCNNAIPAPAAPAVAGGCWVCNSPG